MDNDRLSRFQDALINSDLRYTAILVEAEGCCNADELFRRFNELCYIDNSKCGFSNPFTSKIACLKDELNRCQTLAFDYEDKVYGQQAVNVYPKQIKIVNNVVEKEVIKEVKVPVEKIVEKEVIKEVKVPIEKIIEKEVPVEVIKEVKVPVEKIIEKEVIKEVPIEVINSLDQEKVNLLSAILEQSKQLLEIGKKPRAIIYA